MNFFMHKHWISCFLTTALILLAEECFAKTLSAEFTVVATSPVPDPKKSDYPNCYYSILCSLPPPQKGEIILLIKCFENYKYTDMVAIKAGDRIRAKIIPFDELPEKEKSIQQSDTLERYDLDVFAAVEILPLENFSGLKTELSGTAPESASSIAPPIDEKNRRRIRELINEELSKIDEQISSRQETDIIPNYTESARKRLNDFKRSKNGNDLLFWEGDSIIRIFDVGKLTSDKNTTINDTGIEVITDFDRELKKRNIRLICVSYPEQYELYLPHYCTNVTSLQSFSMPRLKVLKRLLENGVEVMDLGHVFKKRFSQYPYFFDIITPDNHPYDIGVKLLAELLTERLADYDFSDYQYDAGYFSVKKFKNAKRLCYPPGNPNYTGEYTYDNWLNSIPPEKAKPSPVFIIGDSFSVTPWGSTGIRGALGNRMKMLVGGYQNQAGAARIMRTISGRKYRPLNGKRIVIYICSPRVWYSEKWELLATDDRENRIIWELKNISGDALKNQKAVKISGGDFSLAMSQDIDNKSDGSRSALFEVDIPAGYLDGKHTLSIEAELCSPRVQVMICSKNGRVVRESAPTGNDADDDCIAFKLEPHIIRGADNKLRFRFGERTGQLRHITVRNIKIIAKDK